MTAHMTNPDADTASTERDDIYGGASSRYARVCVKPVAHVFWIDDQGRRFDSQLIPACRTIGDAIRARFAAGVMPLGYSYEVVDIRK